MLVHYLDEGDPARLRYAMRQVITLFTPKDPENADGTTVVAFRTAQPLDSLLPHLQHLLEAGAP